jgi:hypothetical protein
MWSWPPRWSSASDTLPPMNWTEPAGRIPDSTMCRKESSASWAVGVAGFTITGTPAMTHVASFSSMPHTGKL